MIVLLLQDVYKLGRAGDVKRVADGYGRNYLIPQGMAILATPGALKQAERIRTTAEIKRAALNQEMGAVAERIKTLVIEFASRAASETDKLYGSVTTQMIAEAIQKKTGIEISRRHIDHQPIRNLGEYKVPVRLTIDLVPEVTVIVYREGEARTPAVSAASAEAPAVEVESPVERTESEDESVHQSTVASDEAGA